jgi:hypothetical protein
MKILRASFGISYGERMFSVIWEGFLSGISQSVAQVSVKRYALGLAEALQGSGGRALRAAEHNSAVWASHRLLGDLGDAPARSRACRKRRVEAPTPLSGRAYGSTHLTSDPLRLRRGSG